MEQTNHNPLTGLIIVIIVLAVAGSIVGGLHYVNVEQPSRAAVQVSEDLSVCSQCPANLDRCTAICKAQSCYTRCQAQYNTCKGACTPA